MNSSIKRPQSPAAAKQTSLRKKLLSWILIPMFILIIVDTSFLYRVAIHYIEKSFDRELDDQANDILELVKVAQVPFDKFQINHDALKVILTDQDDKLYYSILDADGRIINGDQNLPMAINGRPSRKTNEFYSYGNIQRNVVRIVTLKEQVHIGDKTQEIYIQVAETLNKRNRLAKRILIGIVVPQLLLVIAVIATLTFSIGRGLKPLRELNDAITQRSYRELSPIQLTNVPNEVHGLVDSINSLMKQLKSVFESQNRFIADAAHQLRTPLAGIQAQLELAQTESDPQVREASQAQVNLSLERMTHMVSQLLKLAHNQPETVNTINLKTLDIASLAKEVCSEMVPMAYKKNIDLGFDPVVNAYSTLMKGDSERLKVLLQNLIDNAIRYTNMGGNVTVAVKSFVHAIQLSVEDNGIEIPLDEQDKVFERFHRVVDNFQEGSGLGLAIVKEVAQLHNANVKIEKPASGAGTRIVVTFPRS